MAYYLLIAIFFVSIDRFLKVFAQNLAGQEYALLGDFFKFSYAENGGIAFSIPFSGPILLIFLSLLIVILLVYILILAKKSDFTSAGYLTIVLFGAISNMYDRSQYGFVIDYLDLKYFTVFNVADGMIVISVICLLIIEYNNEKRNIKF